MKIPVFALVVGCFCLCAASGAAELKNGRVTQIIRDVQLLPDRSAPRPAAVNDEVRGNTAVRTGVDSRTELKFSDLTIARLGANTIFSVDEGSRTIDLGAGAVLVRVPKNSGGAKISTAAVTAAITGTTLMAEYHKSSIFKFIMMEGVAQITRAGHPEEAVTLRSGEMLSGKPGEPLGKPVTVNAKLIAESSRLMKDFGPLGSDTEGLMAQVFQDQAKAQEAAEYSVDDDAADTGTEILNAIDQRVAASSSSNPPNPPPPTPPPAPGKFGALRTITASKLSVIDSSTVIQTDPSISRNGAMGFGKIYRGAADGAPSRDFFGATSAFDTTSGFDERFLDPAYRPIAAFKFQNLQLAGDPTVSTTNGGALNLALISIGDLTSGASPGTLTFGGIQQLLFATQSGSIMLGSSLSFLDIPALYIYARGVNSNLTFDSAVSGTTDLFLQAQGDLLVTDSLTVDQTNDVASEGFNLSLRAGNAIRVGGDLSLTTDASNIANGGNISVASGGDMTIGGIVELEVFAGAGSTTGTGGNITVTSGGSLTAGSLDFTLDFNNSVGVTAVGENLSLDVTGDLTTTTGGVDLILFTPIGHTLAKGGNLNMTIGGDVSIAEGANLNLTVINTISTTVPEGANLFASVDGDLTAGATNLLIDNSGDGGIGTGGNLSLLVEGSLSAGALDLTIENSSGGQIETGGNIALTTGGSFTAGSLNAFVNNRDGGSIGSGGNIIFAIGGALTTDGDATLGSSNRNDGLGGGMMGADAIVSVQADSIAVGGLLNAFVSANGGGQIGDSARIQFDVTGDINVAGNVLFDLEATAYNIIGGPFLAPGMIGSDALINVSASNLISGAFFTAQIFDRGGQIGGAAGINVSLSGSLSAQDEVDFIIGTGDVEGAPAGAIGGDATIALNSGSLSSALGDLVFLIDNRNSSIGGDASITVNTEALSGQALQARINNSNGSIGGNAAITFNVPGVSNVANATLDIVGGGTVQSASIDINGGTYNVGSSELPGTFLASIGGDGTITLNNATINADTIKVGAFGANGALRIGGGTLSADTLLKLYAPGSNGSIDFVADLTLSSQSTAAVIAANRVTIVDGVLVTIGGQSAAQVFTKIPNYTGSGGNGSTTGQFGGNGATTNPLSQAPPFDETPFVGKAKSKNSHASNPRSIEVRNRGNSGLMSHGAHAVSQTGAAPSEKAVKAMKAAGPAISLESSNQLLALLESAGQTNKNGKVMVDAKHVARVNNGKGQGKPDREGPNNSRNPRSGEDVKRSHDRSAHSAGREISGK